MNDGHQSRDENRRADQPADDHLDGGDFDHVLIVVLSLANAKKAPEDRFGDL